MESKRKPEVQLAATESWYSNRKEEANQALHRGREFCTIGEQMGEDEKIR
jgi:hypothetical protein